MSKLVEFRKNKIFLVVLIFLSTLILVMTLAGLFVWHKLTEPGSARAKFQAKDLSMTMGEIVYPAFDPKSSRVWCKWSAACLKAKKQRSRRTMRKDISASRRR